MSTTVDSKVVEMRFDNRHFESNVSNTMSTLDKLKQKLHFPGAAKGIEDVGHAAKNVNMNGLGSAVEGVQAKFSAMQVVAVTALANITNSAVNAGKRIVSSLTIEPIKSGFQEYEMTLNAVQTTMAATGKTAKEVEDELIKLDEYADKTVYSTADMLNNLPKFTNAGVELETATQAMIGIANATALAGGDASKASIAFYNLGQAISTGYLTRMDYNSINNAGIATMEWKNQMVDAAIAAGTLTKAGDNLYKAGGKTYTLQQLFIDGLQHQWATTDVMLKVFNDYGDETTAIGKKAYSSAQDIKSFSQMMESLKATAGTGWKETWQLVFGGLDEAKVFWTGLSEFISGILNKMTDFRNTILDSALNKSFQGIGDRINGILKPAKEAMKTVQDLEEIVNRVIRGDFGNQGDHGDAQYRNKKLTEAGWEYAVVQNAVNEKLGYSHRLKVKGTQLDKDATQSTEKLAEAEAKRLAELVKLSDAELKNLGYKPDQIKALRELEKVAKKLGIPVDEFIEKIDEIDGRWLLIESFKNIGKSLVTVFKAMGDAWANIFPETSAKSLGDALFDLIAGLHKFSRSLILNKEDADKLRRTFEGLFASLDIVLTIIGGPIKIVFKILSKLLSLCGINILDVTAVIGDATVAVRDWIDEILDFTNVIDALKAPFDKLVKSFSAWIESLKKSKNLPQDIAKGIASGFGKMVSAIGSFFKNLPKMFADGFDGISDSPLGGFLKALGKGLAVAGQVVLELGKIILNKLNEFLSARGFKTISTDAIAGLAKGFKEGASKAWGAALELFKNLVEKVKVFLGIHSPSKLFMVIGGFIIAGLISGLKNSSPEAFGAFKGVIEPIINWLNNINFGAIFAGILGVGTTVSMYKVSNGIGNMLLGLGETFRGTGDILTKSARPIARVVKNTAKVVKSFSKVLNALAFDIKVNAIKELLESITKCVLLLVAALVVLSFIKPGKLWNAVGVIATLAAILIILAFAMNKMSSASATIGKDGLNIKGLSSGLSGIGMAILLLAATAVILGKMDPEQLKQGFWALIGVIVAVGAFLIAFMKIPFGPSDAAIVQSLGKTMKQIGIALLLMAVVVKILGKMDAKQIKQGTLAIFAFSGLMVGLMAATKLISGSKNVASIGSTLLKIALAIGVMALVTKTLGGMKPDELAQGYKAILAFSGIIVGLMAATKLISGSENIDAIGNTLLKIGIAIGVMGLVVRLLGGMSPSEILQGTLAITAFGGIIVGLMAATKLISGSTNVGKVGVTLLAISGAIAAMALTTLLFSLLSLKDIIKGIAIITAYCGIIVGLLAATKLIGNNADKIGKNILMVAGAVGILALIATLLGFVPIKNLIQGTLAITILSAVVAALIFVVSLVKDDVMKPLLALAAIIAVLGGILIALSCLKSDSVLTSAISLSIVLSVLGGLLTLLIPIGKYAEQATKGVWALAKMAVPLAAFGLVLALMSALKVKNAIPNTIALTTLIAAMTPMLIPLSLVSKFVKEAAKGMLALALMAVPLAAFGLVLAMMSALKVADALPNVLALCTLCTVLTLLLIPLTIIGMMGYLPFIGVLALTAMAVPLIAFVGIIALMAGIQNGIANALVLAHLMQVLGEVLVKISLVAPLAIIAVTALTMLISLMVTVGVLAATIGALVKEYPQLQTFLDVGIPILVQMAAGLGQMIGAFISALAGEIMVILPQLGLCLSQFMTNAMPFIEGSKMVDAKVLAGVGLLSAAILALVAADLLAGVVSFLQGGSSFADLGTQLSLFMLNAMPFIMGAALITPEMMSGVKALAETILILTAANILEGLASFLGGGDSLAKFSEQLPILGQGLSGFAASLGGFTPEQLVVVSCAAQAVKALASAAASIPNSGGWVGAIVGENDLGTFAADFPKLGSGLRKFLDSIGTFSEAEAVTVDYAARAIKSLASAASEIPNSGGWMGAILGENDLGTFAADFPKLGSGLRGFLDNIGTFSDAENTTVDCAAKAVKSLAKVASEIPNSGGWVGAIVGENDLGTFAAQFPKLGSGLSEFVTNVGTFGEEQMETVKFASKSVKTLADVASKIPNSGGWVGAIVGDNDLGKFADQFPKLGSGLATFTKNIGTFSKEKVSTVEASVKAINAIGNLAKVDSSKMTNISSVLPKLGTNIKSFSSNMPSKDSLSSASTKVDTLLSAVQKIVNTKSGPLSSFAENLKKVSKDAIKKFVGAFTSKEASTNIEDATKKLGDKAVTGIESKKDKMESAGKDLGSGLVKGINAKQDAVYEAGYALGQKAVQGEKDGQKSKSPSKLTIQAGKWLGEGLIIGMGKMGNQVYKSGSTLGKTATKSLSSSISRISDMVSTDIDTQPTIRPVLDLSDVRSGASVLGNMLDMDSSIGVRTNIGAISSMMSLRGQNGGNGDIVSAIDKLSKKMDNMGNTTYHIDGVTYDDGSNVANAVSSLTRAIRMERRV